MNTFEELDLFGPLKKALAEQGYERPTPIQAKTIPPAIAGNDILGSAQTGTGKTAAFALPILDYLGKEPLRAQAGRPQALILAPTRELAVQIGDSFRAYGKHMRFRQALVYGGVNQNQQVKSMRSGVNVVIATPGRLIDLMQQGHIDLRDVEQFVLDEADRMLDMGFLPALKQIIAKLPKERQSLFFSATLPPKIRELAADLLFNPVSVDVTPKVSSVKKIDQRIRLIERSNKMTALHDMICEAADGRVIVFTRTKRGANAVAGKLDRQGVSAVAIHGNKSQNARQRALDGFRKNKVKVLVATDVAARGIDIDGVTHVINYDMPNEPESYVHRVGRTGRAGADGIAVAFCTPDEAEYLRDIEKLIGQRLDVDDPDGLASKLGQAGSRSSNQNGGGRPRSGQRSGSSRKPGKRRRFGNGSKGKSSAGKSPRVKREAVSAR